MIQEFHDPRRYLLQRATTPDRPLICAQGGFSQRCDLPGVRSFSRGMFNANFVEVSGLSPWAETNNVNVCWIDSSKFGGPWYRRNWTWRDVGDVTEIRERCVQMVQPSEVYDYGFSDGATLGHYLALGDGFDAVVCHSGMFPRDVALRLADGKTPVLLIVGADEPHKAVVRATVDAADAYLEAERKVGIWRVPDLSHEFAVGELDNIFDWCKKA